METEEECWICALSVRMMILSNLIRLPGPNASLRERATKAKGRGGGRKKEGAEQTRTKWKPNRLSEASTPLSLTPRSLKIGRKYIDLLTREFPLVLRESLRVVLMEFDGQIREQVDALNHQTKCAQQAHSVSTKLLAQFKRVVPNIEQSCPGPLIQAMQYKIEQIAEGLKPLLVRHSSPARPNGVIRLLNYTYSDLISLVADRRTLPQFLRDSLIEVAETLKPPESQPGQGPVPTQVARPRPTHGNMPAEKPRIVRFREPDVGERTRGRVACAHGSSSSQNSEGSEALLAQGSSWHGRRARPPLPRAPKAVSDFREIQVAVLTQYFPGFPEGLREFPDLRFKR
eukprot:gnl/Chilomastix_cuspidata/2574.p1 GENE.gnl/Chilomastix_cuspidata/2574~~gnl/Chilomastix_cuspidata/2574.p1  ORF type:complete len:343 (+),score=44.46 gnl/Chilomastix_cuspidata/2574:247-1275(+)